MTAVLLTLIILVSMLPVVGLATETEILTDDFSAGLHTIETKEDIYSVMIIYGFLS